MVIVFPFPDQSLLAILKSFILWSCQSLFTHFLVVLMDVFFHLNVESEKTLVSFLQEMVPGCMSVNPSTSQVL